MGSQIFRTKSDIPALLNISEKIRDNFNNNVSVKVFVKKRNMRKFCSIIVT